MSKLYWNILLFSFLVAAGGPSLAETVKIPVGQQAPGMRDTQVPNRGMTREKVEQAFGTPMARSRAVGEPPISYWEFEHYYVYFENDRVLHTVFKRTETK